MNVLDIIKSVEHTPIKHNNNFISLHDVTTRYQTLGYYNLDVLLDSLKTLERENKVTLLRENELIIGVKLT